MRVIFITGPTCAGKTTFAGELLERSTSTHPPILLPIGEAAGNILGPKLSRAERNRPDCPSIESWVRSLFSETLAIALQGERDLVVDGMPRSPAQLLWCLGECLQHDNIRIEMCFLTVTTDVAVRRFRNRHKAWDDSLIQPEFEALFDSGVRMMKHLRSLVASLQTCPLLFRHLVAVDSRTRGK